jgi:ribonuclease BN (tRNA processing enzyme)
VASALAAVAGDRQLTSSHAAALAFDRAARLTPDRAARALRFQVAADATALAGYDEWSLHLLDSAREQMDDPVTRARLDHARGVRGIIARRPRMAWPVLSAAAAVLEAYELRLAALAWTDGALAAFLFGQLEEAQAAVCVSHHHADHCLDICPFWVARTYGPGGRLPRIPVYGPEGTALRMAQACGLDEHPGTREAFGFVTLAPGKREIGPFQITLAHMNHPVETSGFRVEQAGRALAYSADTGTSPALVELASQADVLLCEAPYLSGPDPGPDMHLTARQAAEHAARAVAGRLIPTHLVPWNDQQVSLAEASAVSYDGTLSLAAPGQVIALG